MVKGVPIIWDEGELRARSARLDDPKLADGMFIGEVGMPMRPGYVLRNG